MKNSTKIRNLVLGFMAIFILLLVSKPTFLNAQNCTVNAGVEASICENEQLFLYGSTSGAFSGGSPLVKWTQISGPSVLIVNPNSLVTEVQGIAGNTSYTFRISTTCLDGSLIYQDVTKYVLPITDAEAGDDFETCSGIAQLNANSPGDNETGYWYFADDDIKNGISIDDRFSASASITVDGSTCGQTLLVWRIYNMVSQCYSTDTIGVTNQGGLMPVSAGSDIYVDSCYSTSQSTRLNASFGGCSLGGQVGTWTVASGPNVPVFDDVNDNNTRISNLIEGTYTLQWDVEGPCASGSDQMQIFVAAPTSDVTNAGGTGETQIFCDGRTEIVLNGTFPQYTYETVLWEQIDANSPVNILNPTNQVTTVQGLDGSSEYRFRYTITNNSTNCNSTAVVTIQYAEQPTIHIDVDRVDLLCYQSTAYIDYSETGDGPAAWSIVSGPTTSEYPTIPTNYQTIDSTTVKVEGLFETGTYIIRFRKSPTVGSTCETSFDDVQVIVSDAGDLSNAGTDQFLACNVDTTALAGNEPFQGIGTWSQVSGPNTAIISDINYYNSEIKNLVNGTYIFRWIIDDGPFCYSNQDEVEIIVADTVPHAAIAGPDTNVCAGSPVFLYANPPILNEWGHWTISPNTGVVWGNNTSNVTYVDGLSANQTYELIWTLENACGAKSDTMLISTNNIQGPTLADAGPDACYSSGTTSIILNGNNPSPGTGQWNVVSGPNLPTFVYDTLYNTEVNGLTGGTYEFVWEVSTDFSCEPTRDTVVITLANDVSFTYAGDDLEVCGNDVFLDADSPTTGTGSWSQYSGPGGAVIVNPDDTNTEITGLTDGVYTFAWTVSNNACTDTVDLVTVYVSTPPTIPSAGADDNVCKSNQYILNANAVNLGLWNFISGPNTPNISDFNSPTATLSNLIMGTYTLSWSSYSGPFCEPLNDTVVIEVVPQANAGSDQEYCIATDAVDLIGNVNSNGVWQQIGNTPTVANINTTSGNTATASNLITGIYTFVYAITSSACPENTDTMTVTLYDPPSVATAGDDQYFCEADTFYLVADTILFGQKRWVKLFGPSGGHFLNGNDSIQNAIFIPDSANKYGTFVFAWTASNGNCTNQDQLRVENYEAPTVADAGFDKNLICDTIVYMDAMEPTAGTGLWTLINNSGNAKLPVNILSEITHDTEISGLGTTDGNTATYEFEWMVSNGPDCSVNRDTIIISVEEAASLADAGSDTSLCETVPASYTMLAVTPTSGTGTWSANSGNPAGGIIDTPSSENTTISSLGSGTYKYYWTVENGACSSVDSVSIKNNSAPVANIADDTTKACEFENVQILADAAINGTGRWTQTDGPAAIIQSPLSNSTIILGLEVDSIYKFRWTVSNGVCTDDFDEVVVNVDPLPEANDLNVDYCSNLSIDIDLLAQVLNPAGVTFTYTVFSSDETNVPAGADRIVASNANITELAGTYINTTNTPVDIIYTVTPISNAGCEGYPFQVWIELNPEPVVSDTTALACSDVQVGFNLRSLLPSGAMRSGSTFTYTIDAAPGSGSDYILNESYTNTTDTPYDVTYRIVPTSGQGCVGDTFDLVVTVNPEPVYTGNTSVTVCSVSPIGITLPATDDSGLSIGSYDISANVPGGLSGTATEGTDLTGIDTLANDAFTNTTSENLSVEYIITPISDGCSGTTFTRTAVIQPEPVVANLGDTICIDSLTFSGAASISLATSNAIAGTSFSWGVPVLSEADSITGGNPGFGSTISDNFTNTSLSLQTATYKVVPTSPTSCIGDTADVVVLVNPLARVTNPGTQVFCNEATATVNFSSPNNGVTVSYSWTNNNTSIGLAASGTGNLNFTAINTGNAPDSAEIIITPIITYTGISCSGLADTFKIVVNPSGQVNPSLDQELCAESVTETVKFSTVNTLGTTLYSWTNNQSSIGLADSGANVTEIPSFTATNSGSDSIVATIVVTPHYTYLGENCDGTADTFLIVVNPIPTISSESEVTICNGEDVNYIPTSETYGTIFSWTATNTVGAVNGWDSTGAGPINNILTNADVADGQVVYEIIPFGPDTTNCEGPKFSLEVNIIHCNPVIGLSNQLVSVINNGDGTHEALFNYRIQNYGNTELNNIQVIQNLDSAFGEGNYIVKEITSTSFAVDTGFYGNGADTLMLVSEGNTLQPGASTDIVLKITILTEGTFDLTATTTGEALGGTIVSDVSHNGSDPDPDYDNDPTEVGENDPTPVSTSCINPTAEAGPDNSICWGDIYQVVGASTANDSAFVWTTTGDGAFNSNTEISPVYTPGAVDSTAGSVVLYLTAYAYGTCPDVEDSLVLTINSFSATVVKVDASCDSNEDGSAQITASGGLAPYTYNLSIGESNSTGTFETLAAGGYIYTITDDNGCTFEGSFEIDDPNELELTVYEENDVSCYGDSTGSLRVEATGGTAPYSYVLGTTTQVDNGTFTNLTAGVYVVTVTDFSGCIELETVEIEEPTELEILLVDQVNIGCDGITSGSIRLSGSGGIPGYSYLVVAQPSGGTTAVVSGNLVSNMEEGDYQIEIKDLNGCTDTLAVQISSESCGPIAVDDNVVTPEDSPVTGDVTINDISSTGTKVVTQFVIGGTTYTAGDTATITGVGDLVIFTDGSYYFGPVDNYNGPVPTATYTLSDGSQTDTADLNIVVTPDNDIPVVVADTFLTIEDTPISGSVALNDTISGDGGNIWSIETNPTNGTVILNSDGTFTYTPNSDYTGGDSFSYKLCDVDGDCATETVSLTVSSVNDAPIAVDDYTATSEDTPVTVAVVNNDNFGGDGPAADSISIISQPINGIAVINDGGTPSDPTDDQVVYTPNPDFEGNDSFIYEICDANGDCDQATAIINVNAVDDSPIAVPDTASVNEDAVLNGNLAVNDTISGDGGNVWSVVTGPSNGTLVINVDGTYTYTPDEDYHGSDSFTYQLCDVDGSCSSASVVLTVNPLNDPPVVQDVPKTGSEDADITFDISDFTSKFTDIDGDTLTRIQIVTLPPNGTLNLSGSPVSAGDTITKADIPNLTFTPDSNWNGTTIFDWNGYDGNSYALINEQVNITITPENDPPVAGLDTIPAQVNPGGINTIPVPATSFSGTDIDGTIDSLIITSLPADATSITIDGTVYTSIPPGGIKIPTTNGGQPLFDVEIDPANGVSNVVLEYFVIDNEGLPSVSSGSVTIPFGGLTVSGNVYNDTDGLSDGIVNGTGTNAGGNLFVNLVNDLNQVVATDTIAADGSYSFSESDGLESNETYKLIITSTPQSPGATLSSATYPAGFTSTGENIGSGVGDDGIIDGILEVNTNGGSLGEANFGVNGEMTVSTGPDAEMCSSEGSYTISGASATNYSSLLWTSSGTGTFASGTTINAVYTPSAADIATGQVQLTLTATGIGSVAEMSDMMVLDIWPQVNAFAGNDTTICSNEPIILSGASASNYATLTWTSTGGSFNNANALNPTFIPSTTGDITLVLTVAGLGTCADLVDTVIVTVYEELVLEAPDVTNANCDSQEDGSVKLGIASGGTAPFTFELSTGEFNTTGEFTGLASGGYVYWVSDLNGCTARGAFEVDDPNELELTVVSENDETCINDNNGSATVIASGGSGSYSFEWIRSGSAGTFTGVTSFDSINVLSDMEAGFYVVTVTDANGCIEIESLEIEEPTELEIVLVDQINPDCDNSGQLIVNGTGGTPGYTFTSSSGAVNGNIISDLTAGTDTIIIEDVNGCLDSLFVTLVNEDISAPTFTCPSTQTVYTDANCESTVPDLIALVTDEADNCVSIPIVSQSIASGTTINNDVVVTVSVADSSGNVAECEVLINVVDTTSPTAVCQPLSVQLDMTGSVYISPDDIDGGSFDNCGLSSIDLDITSFDCTNIGPNSVVLRVTDDSGNTSTCSTTVTIEDNIDPILDCPAPVTLGADVNCEVPVPDFVGALSSNNCGTATISQLPLAGTFVTLGVNPVTITATDLVGNTSTCIVDVTIIDTTPPAYTCPAPISINTDGGLCYSEIVLAAPVVDDNCDSTDISIDYRVYGPDNSLTAYIDASVNTYQFMVGISQVEWRMIDKAGNISICTQEVEIIENEDPVIICPTGSPFSFTNTNDVCGYVVSDQGLDATATDNCSLLSLTHNYGAWGNPNSLSGATFPVGTTEVIWTAVDANGNSSNCTITINVADEQAPEFVNCPDSDTLTVALFTDICEGSAIWSIPIARDNCSGVLVEQTDGPERGSLLDAGYYKIEYTATDASANSTICSFTLHVTDSEGPIVVCPPNIYQNNDEGVCSWTAPANSVTPLLAVSNCPFDVTYEITGVTTATGMDDASGTTFNLGTSLVIYTITEPVSGQSWNCSFSVTVFDAEAPAIICPDPISEVNDFGLCSNIIDLELPEFTDNCNDDLVNIYYKVYEPNNRIQGPFSSSELAYEFIIGINQVEWIVEDAAGNIATCMQEVSVGENEDPVIVCPERETYIFKSTPNLCGYKVPDNILDAYASDNCIEYTISHNFGDWALPSTLKGAVIPVGTTEIIWTATDKSGNSVSCSIEVIVTDSEPPVFVNCPSGKTFTVGLFSGACEGGAIWSIPVATDNCSYVTVTQTRGPAQGESLAAGSYYIEYQAKDAGRNTAECGFTVVVTDTEDPVIVCQPDLIKESDPGTCTWTSISSSLSPLLANSNCPASVTWQVENPDNSIVTGVDDVSGYVFELGTSTVSYYISEEVSGQDWDCSFTVTVIDKEAPIIECQPSIQLTALPGECSAEIELIVPVFSDNCATEAHNITYRVFGADNSTSGLFTSDELGYKFKVGINRVEWRVEDAAGNYSLCLQDVWILADKEALIPEAGPNARICESDSLVFVSASAPEFAEIEWTTSGSGHFIDDNAINPVYIPSPVDIVDGFVILTITSSTECASASDQMILSISRPPIVSSGNDAVICESDIYQLFGSIINSAMAVQWETTGTGNFSNNEIFNPVYTPSEADIEAGEVQIIFKGISGGACNDDADTMNLIINRQPIISAGSDGFVCEEEEFSITDASLLYAEDVVWTTNGTGTFDDKTKVNPVYKPSEGDILNGNVELTISHNPEGPCNNVTDAMLLTISKHPTASAGQNISTCFGQSAMVTGASASNFSKIEWTSDGNGSLQNAGSLSPIYVPADDETGTVTLQLTVIGENACIEDTIVDEIELEIFDLLIAKAGDDDTIYYNTSALLSVEVENGSGSYFYNWQPSAFVYDPTSNYTETVDLSESIDFEVTVTDANTGCVASDLKIVFVEESADKLVGFYNAFTPNNDGVNDTWIIEGIDKFPENEVLIFNRWGDKIKELQNYDNVKVSWDGTNMRDKPVPDGTYYYVVTLKDVKSYTGWIHIRSER